MPEASDPIESARRLLARSPATPSSSAVVAWRHEAEAAIVLLEASMISIDYRARQLLQRTGELRAEAKEKSLLGRFRRSPDERKNLAEQDACRSDRERCRKVIEQLRNRIDGT